VLKTGSLQLAPKSRRKKSLGYSKPRHYFYPKQRSGLLVGIHTQLREKLKHTIQVSQTWTVAIDEFVQYEIAV
jgi:hypothetical protein